MVSLFLMKKTFSFRGGREGLASSLSPNHSNRWCLFVKGKEDTRFVFFFKLQFIKINDISNPFKKISGDRVS